MNKKFCKWTQEKKNQQQIMTVFIYYLKHIYSDHVTVIMRHQSSLWKYSQYLKINYKIVRLRGLKTNLSINRSLEDISNQKAYNISLILNKLLRSRFEWIYLTLNRHRRLYCKSTNHVISVYFAIIGFVFDSLKYIFISEYY